MQNTARWARNFAPWTENRLFQQPRLKAAVTAPMSEFRAECLIQSFQVLCSIMLVLKLDEHFSKGVLADVSHAVSCRDRGRAREIRHDLITIDSEAVRPAGFAFNNVEHFSVRPGHFQR